MKRLARWFFAGVIVVLFCSPWVIQVAIYLGLHFQIVARDFSIDGSPTPQEFGLEPEVVWFESTDGVPLYGELFLPDDEPTAVIVWNHGYNGDFGVGLREFYPQVVELTRQGYAVFLPDHAGWGRSGSRLGKHLGYSEWKDVIASINEVKKHVPETPVIVLGKSAGAPAVLIAATMDEFAADAIVAVVPYGSVPTLFSTEIPHRYPWVPDWAIKPLTWLAMNALRFDIGFAFDRLDPLKTAGRISVPALVLSGPHDPLVPMSDAEAITAMIASSVGSEKVRHVIVEGGGHNLFRPEGPDLNPDPDAMRRAYDALFSFVDWVIDEK